MKHKRLVIKLILAALIFILGSFIGLLIFNHVSNKTDDSSLYITKANASRMMVCLSDGSLEYSDSVTWYIKYMQYCIDNGLETWKADELTEIHNQPLTYGELGFFLDYIGCDAKDIERNTGLKMKANDVPVSKIDFNTLYDYLVVINGEDGHVTRRELSIVATPATLTYSDLKNLGKYRCVTTAGVYEFEGLAVDAYCDKKVCAYVSGRSIVSIVATVDDSVTYENVYITYNTSEIVSAYMYGIVRNFDVKGLTNNISGNVADVCINGGVVTDFLVKTDFVNGKVYKISNDTLELEGYRTLTIADGFKVYNLINGIREDSISSILVGYKQADFIVADGKVCAALINREINPTNIRVLIMNTDYETVFHDRISVTSETGFEVITANSREIYEAGEVLDIYPGASLLEKGRVKISAVEAHSSVKLLTVERSYGNPSYLGSLEITEENGSLVCINEVPLEQYLCAVVPSEMPVKFGVEALKVMAVCARSYAYNHILGNTYRMYGAHVDDSVNYQVYNNIKWQEQSTQAVYETKGEILTKDGKAVSAYYYSTSCGYGSDFCIWNGEASDIYESGTINKNRQQYDLSDEDNFRAFLNNENEEDFDYEFPYYRWNVTVPIDDAKSRINEYLGKRYNVEPYNILTLSSGGKFESCSIEDIGEITDMYVAERTKSGAVRQLVIVGSRHTVLIIGELNIRYILGPGENELNTHTDTQTVFYILPSVYMYFDKEYTDGKISGIVYHGGGYGHGIGMSQNAVSAMVKRGMRYDEILNFFYNGTAIEQIH